MLRMRKTFAENVFMQTLLSQTKYVSCFIINCFRLLSDMKEIFLNIRTTRATKMIGT